MEGYQPRLPAFRPPNHQLRVPVLDIGVVKRQRLRNPQPRHHEQSKHGGECQPTQPHGRGQLASGLQKPIDIRVLIERRGLAVIPRREQIDRRDFGQRISHVTPLGKPSHDLEARVHADRTEIREVRRPAPREIGRHAEAPSRSAKPAKR